MTIMIKPTDQITTVDGIKARVWYGRDDKGRPCIFFVARVAYPEGSGEVPDLEELLPPPELVDVAKTLETHTLRSII